MLRVASSSVNDSQTVGYTYDDDGLLTGAGDLTLTPDPGNGLLAATSMANPPTPTTRVTTSHSYNAFGELSTQSAAYGQSALFSEQITERDALGRILQRVETTSQGTDTFDYTYEPTTGFLDTVSKDSDQIADYGYDPNGNRETRLAGGTTLTGTYDAQDRLISYGPNSYDYTEAGDLKSKHDGSHVTDYEYDELGALEHVTLEAESATPIQLDYVNDGLGRRIAKKRGGNLEQGFVYGAEALGPVAELDAQGDVRSRFVYATRANVPDYMVRAGSTYRILTDRLGSPRMIVDTSTGQVAQEMDFDEYGNVVRDTAPGFQPFGFAGGFYDRDTLLLRFGARDYDPQSGRWTVKDPFLFGGGDTNVYGYVVADPVNRVDRLGLSWQDVGTAIVGGVDGATFGGTAWLRDRFDLNGELNKCSALYRNSELAGRVGSSLVIGSGSGAAASAFARQVLQASRAKSVIGGSAVGGGVEADLANDPAHPDAGQILQGGLFGAAGGPFGELARGSHAYQLARPGRDAANQAAAGTAVGSSANVLFSGLPSTFCRC